MSTSEYNSADLLNCILNYLLPLNTKLEADGDAFAGITRVLHAVMIKVGGQVKRRVYAQPQWRNTTRVTP